jgi:hypothetical protein
MWQPVTKKVATFLVFIKELDLFFALTWDNIKLSEKERIRFY